MLLAAGSAVFGWINMRRARAAEQQAEQAKAAEIKLRVQAEVEEHAARHRAYASDMNIAMQAMRDSNLGRALDLLNRQRPQPGQQDLRGWEWRYLWQQTRSDAVATLYRDLKGEINAVAASPDGRWLAAGTFHLGGVRVWDLATREQVALCAPNDGLVRAAFSPTEPMLAFTSTDLSPDAGGRPSTKLHLWSTATRQMLAELPLDEGCLGVAFSSDGKTLVTSSSSSSNDQGHITLWRMPDGAKLASYTSQQRNSAPGTGFAAAPDLSVAAYGTGDGRVRVVDLHDGRELWSAAATNGQISALAFSPDGKTLATAGAFNESDIRLWDVASGSETGRLVGHQSWVSALVFWPDGKKLASTSADQTIRTWDVASRQPLDMMRGHRNEVWRLVLLPDGRTLVSGGKDGDVSVWDTSILHQHRERITWPEPVEDWRFADEGRAILTVKRNGQVAKWTGPHYGQKEILFDAATEFDGTFSSDARWLATRMPDGQIGIWDIDRRTVVDAIKLTSAREYPVAILANGTRLVTYSPLDNQEREWDVPAQREIQAWQCPSVPQAGGGSRNERWSVVVGFEGRISLRDLPAQQSTFPNLDVLEPGSTGFSPDGKYFVVASYLGYVRLWNTANWSEVATLRGYRLGVHSAAFSLDGKRLATGGGSAFDTVKLWDAESWQDVLTLDGLGSAWGTTISADGNAVASVSNSRIIQVWQAPTWAEIAAAEKAQGGDSAAH